MENKKIYLPAGIAIVPLNAEDLLTTSGGWDENDNWSDDVFDGGSL